MNDFLHIFEWNILIWSLKNNRFLSAMFLKAPTQLKIVSIFVYYFTISKHFEDGMTSDIFVQS